MLDAITLRLDYYRELFEILYELYSITPTYSSSQEPLASDLHWHLRRPTSIFIMRICLGWLFDQPNVPAHYYQYRQHRKPLTAMTNITNMLESKSRTIETVGANDGKSVIINCACNTNTTFTSNDAEYMKQFDPLLESILIAACPFLADFRVSIMPKKNLKTVSRTGRYRHVTTKLLYERSSSAHRNVTTPNSEDPQKRLADAFIQSQTLSVRRTVEFVLERTTSAVIKNFQVERFIPIKHNVMAQVHAFSVSEALVKHVDSAKQQQFIERKLYDIFEEGERKMVGSWNSYIPPMIKARVQVSISFVYLFISCKIATGNHRNLSRS